MKKKKRKNPLKVKILVICKHHSYLKELSPLATVCLQEDVITYLRALLYFDTILDLSMHKCLMFDFGLLPTGMSWLLPSL